MALPVIASAAKQSRAPLAAPDCRVAPLLAMTNIDRNVCLRRMGTSSFVILNHSFVILNSFQDLVRLHAAGGGPEPKATAR
jgi:hypothetical protein